MSLGIAASVLSFPPAPASCSLLGLVTDSWREMMLFPSIATSAAPAPIARAAEIKAPVLLFHGRRDARVPVSQVAALAGALKRAGQDCDLTIFQDEGHRYSRPQNVASLRSRTVAFLLRNLSTAADSAVR